MPQLLQFVSNVSPSPPPCCIAPYSRLNHFFIFSLHKMSLPSSVRRAHDVGDVPLHQTSSYCAFISCSRGREIASGRGRTVGRNQHRLRYLLTFQKCRIPILAINLSSRNTTRKSFLKIPHISQFLLTSPLTSFSL